MAKDEERNYSFNLMSLLIKVVIFAILLVLLIWFLSKFTGGSKRCKTIVDDYYAVSSFTDVQYETKGDSDTYTYSYTLKLLNINKNNSKNVSIKNYNYIHSDSEYEDYIENSEKANIINQSNNSLVIDNATSLMNSSLTASEFTYDISDVYEFDGEYYIDVTLDIGDYSGIESYNGNYFVPIHISIEYTQTGDCKGK